MAKIGLDGLKTFFPNELGWVNFYATSLVLNWGYWEKHKNSPFNSFDRYEAINSLGHISSGRLPTSSLCLAVFQRLGSTVYAYFHPSYVHVLEKIFLDVQTRWRFWKLMNFLLHSFLSRQIRVNAFGKQNKLFTFCFLQF